jgi:hypothetical protein
VGVPHFGLLKKNSLCQDIHHENINLNRLAHKEM